MLFRSRKPKKRLRAVLKTLRDEYDVVFLDCPPNLTMLTENVFHAADFIIHPTVPTTLSQRTLERLIEFFDEEKLPTTNIVPFFSMAETRKSLHKDTMTQLPELIPGFLETAIPYLSEIERMGVYREPAPARSGHTHSNRMYADLWNEIKERTGI